VSFAKFKETLDLQSNRADPQSSSVIGGPEGDLTSDGPGSAFGKALRFRHKDEVQLDQELLDAISKLIPERKTPLTPQEVVEKNQYVIKTIMMRLSDLLFLSADSVSPQERALADDLISRLFDRAARNAKLKIVERILHLSEPPPSLTRVMLHSEDEIALPILRSPVKLKQADLISVVMTSGAHYQRAVAERESLHSAVCDTIIQCADVSTIRIMLRNRTSVISRTGFVRLAEKSLKERGVLEPLIERLDFPADLAHLVFWWSPSKLRRTIIERFACPRQTVFDIMPQDVMEDFGDLIPEVSNALRMARKAQKMDRVSIDAALDELEEGDANLALDALAAGAHLRAETIAQILDDQGGEAIGVFCKAIGFGRERFMRIRQILSDRKGQEWNPIDAIDDDVSIVHDTLSTDKADLILRYWDRATREIEI
jgi:uncharacterized protein (DUF2336 family)